MGGGGRGARKRIRVCRQECLITRKRLNGRFGLPLVRSQCGIHVAQRLGTHGAAVSALHLQRAAVQNCDKVNFVKHFVSRIRESQILKTFQCYFH